MNGVKDDAQDALRLAEEAVELALRILEGRQNG